MRWCACTQRLRLARRRHHREVRGFVLRPLALLLALGLGAVVTPAAGQTAARFGTLSVRHGWEAAGGRDGARGVGLELEVRPHGRVAPGIRYERWDFGIECVGLGPCPSGVTAWTLGGTVRGWGGGRLVPWVGADMGSMRWTSGATGMSLRGRSGWDLRLGRAGGLSFELAYTRFLESSTSSARMLQRGILGAAMGVRVGY